MLITGDILVCTAPDLWTKKPATAVASILSLHKESSWVSWTHLQMLLYQARRFRALAASAA